MSSKLSSIALGVALVVALSLAAPLQALAEHKIEVLDADGFPMEGVQVRIWVQIGPDPNDPNDWASATGETNAQGVFINQTLQEHALATFWRAEMIDPEFELDPPQQPNPAQIDYPTKTHTFNVVFAE